MDIARGLSEPERCPQCRKFRRQEISSDAIFKEPPKEYDDAKRCWRKFGLSALRKPLTREPIPEQHIFAVAVTLPQLWLKNPR